VPVLELALEEQNARMALQAEKFFDGLDADRLLYADIVGP